MYHLTTFFDGPRSQNVPEPNEFDTRRFSVPKLVNLQIFIILECKMAPESKMIGIHFMPQCGRATLQCLCFAASCAGIAMLAPSQKIIVIKINRLLLKP